MLDRALLLCSLLLAGCPAVFDDDDLGDDDDLFGDDDDATANDDDATGDDDDSTSDPTAPIYDDEEAWFALVPGSAWRYVETVAAVPDPITDDVELSIGRRISANTLPGGWSAELAGLEVIVDRLFGDDEVHWIGLSGTGVAIWLGSEVSSGFETEVIEGDGAVILRRAAGPDDLIDEAFDAAWFLPDEGATDVETIANGLAPFVYDAGPTEGVDCLETEVQRNGSFAGFQYWQPVWGLLGMSVELSAGGVTWEIEACSTCPPSSGLPQP